MRYRCEDCDSVFDESEMVIESYTEYHSWLEDCPGEVFTEYRCPECGSTYVVEEIGDEDDA